MKRRFLLIAGLLLGAASVALNIQLYFVKREPPVAVPSRERAPDFGKPAMVPTSHFDFSGTAFDDNAWKLSEPESAVKIDKPFDWEDVNPVQPRGSTVKQMAAPKESYAGAPANPAGSGNPAVPAPK
jgi:hypothetical protein